jgi:hypothetical protein
LAFQFISRTECTSTPNGTFDAEGLLTKLQSSALKLVAKGKALAPIMAWLVNFLLFIFALDYYNSNT